MKTDPRIEAWKESYQLANNTEPPVVASAGRGWWRIGSSSACYRAADFVRFRENLRAKQPSGDGESIK